jgi:protein-tyrosine phosphatase
MSLSGLCDLHCHYVPNVDDGVRSAYSTVVATPHMRPGMFDNDKAQLTAAFDAFVATATTRAGEGGLPELALSAEHFLDDAFMDKLGRDQTLPYPGGHAALIEFPPDRFPLGLDDCLFRMRVRGIRPVIAHPERYAPLWISADPLEHLLERGAVALLDTMSLLGKYGRKSKTAAERMLEAGLYYAACSDSHKPEDVDTVAQAIERLVELAGEEEAQELLGDHPRQILAGTVAD